VYLNTVDLRDSAINYSDCNAKLRCWLMAHLFASESNGYTADHENDLELAYRFNRKRQATLLSSIYLTKGGIQGLDASQHYLST
jgi:hypothetical protein